jgi:hypothetical protein
MPSHMRRMQLKGPACVSASASCDEHRRVRVRMRKADLADMGNGGMQPVDIYASCAASEPLQVRLGSTLTIELKEGRALDFRVVAIRVLPALSTKVRFLRACILSGYFSEGGCAA